MGSARWILMSTLALGSACLALAGCGGDKVEAPGGGEETAWSYGGSRTYAIPPDTYVTVIDSASATVFRLPSGGGEFTIRDIIAGPMTAADEGAFEIEYTGTSDVQLLVPHDSDDLDYVLGYSSLAYAVLEAEPPDTSGWMPILESATLTGPQGDSLVFDLPLSSGQTDAPVSEVTKYKKLTYRKDTDIEVLSRQIEQNIRDAATSLIDFVPASRQAAAMEAINGPLEPRFYVPENREAWVYTEDPKYIPFWDYTALVPRCWIVIPDNSVGSVAHEVGHYFHHVLIGNYAYGSFFRNPRPDGHHIGMEGAFANLIEEPAYLAEYLLKGSIGMSSNPENGSVLTNGHGNSPTPRTVDYRDLEGMGVALCAALIRSDNLIYNHTGERTTVPVIAGDRVEKARDCYEIIAQGTDDILELRDKLETLLVTEYGGAEALPAMLEPLGWSYHVNCRFVDAQGEPVSGLEARSVCKAGGREYVLPVRGTPSDDQGRYTLERFFPGKSTLRVYHGTDSTDVADITIPWTRATTQENDLGDIYIEGESDLLAKLRTRGGMYSSVTGIMDVSGGEPAHVGFGFSIYDYAGNVCDSLKWNGVEGHYGCTRTTEDGWERHMARDSIYVRAAITARSLETLYLRTERVTTVLADQSQTIYITEIELTDVPVLYYPGDPWGSDKFTFDLEEAEMPTHVRRAYYRSWSTHFGGVESSTFLSSPDGAGITFEHYSSAWDGAPGRRP